jgi:hypothetical protein
MKKAVIGNLFDVPLDVQVALNTAGGVILYVFRNAACVATIKKADASLLQIRCPDGSETRFNMAHVLMYDVHEHGVDTVSALCDSDSVRFDYSDYIYEKEDSDDE